MAAASKAVQAPSVCDPRLCSASTSRNASIAADRDELTSVTAAAL